MAQSPGVVIVVSSPKERGILVGWQPPQRFSVLALSENATTVKGSLDLPAATKVTEGIFLLDI
jgi:hypothetical protein